MSRAYRVVCIGEGGVGKSCLTIQFISERFVEEYDPTLEDSYRKQLTVDDEEYLLDIFDTAGQEDFSAVRDQYMRTGDGFLGVYSITTRHSLQRVRELYDHVRRVKDLEDIAFVLLGNKCDLEEDREVSKEEGEGVAKELNVKFLETSAKTRHNVEESFQTIVKEINSWKEHHQPPPDKRKNKICLLL